MHANCRRDLFAEDGRATSYSFAVSVRILDRDGGDLRCGDVTDTRGGIGPHPGSDAETSDEGPREPVTVSGEIVIEPCTLSSIAIDDVSHEPFLVEGCVETAFGARGVARIIPNEMMVDQPAGYECVIDFDYSSLGSNCYRDEVEYSVVSLSYNGEFWSAPLLVPENAVQVVALTAVGEEIVAIPYQRLAYLWGSGTPDGLLSIVIETEGDPIQIYPES